jgi:hypothetical protein
MDFNLKLDNQVQGDSTIPKFYVRNDILSTVAHVFEGCQLWLRADSFSRGYLKIPLCRWSVEEGVFRIAREFKLRRSQHA